MGCLNYVLSYYLRGDVIQGYKNEKIIFFFKKFVGQWQGGR